MFSAIRYAQEKHVVHRDLKPGNILVTADGTVKLLDFGIAKLLPGAEDTISLTRSNLLAMTPEYASPEQIRAEVVTPLSDVYSLGVLAYELLTGRRPYRLRSRIFHEIARVICEEPPTRPSAAVTRSEPAVEGAKEPQVVSWSRGVSPEELRRELTGDMDGILLKALEKDPLAFERGTITIPNDPALLGELQAFEAKSLPSGMTCYAAPEGLHDDCVISLALAWQGLGTWVGHRSYRAIELEPVRISLV